jgi:hypothetical protein
MTRWIGFDQTADGKWAKHYFNNLGFHTKLSSGEYCHGSFETAQHHGVRLNIEFARYKKHVADSIGMDYDLCKQFNEEYNKLYQNLGMGRRYQKYVLDAPDGPKGGHCVTPNNSLMPNFYMNNFPMI